MNERKKLLFIVESLATGILTYLADLTSVLAKDFDITIAHSVRKETQKDFRDCFAPCIRFISVKRLSNAIRPRENLCALYEIRRIVREVQPNVVHLHSTMAGVLGRLAMIGIDIPVFYTPHGYSFLMQNTGKMRRRIYHLIEYICAKLPCRTIACSESEYRETLRLTKRALRVDNGINVFALESLLTKPSESERVFTVFTSGRISVQKNPDEFNRIALALPRVRFIWIGDGELRDRLTAPNISITGWLGRREALLTAEQADAFILPSLWEGLSISLLEAMYMKKTCIVSNVDGNRSVVRDGMNGYVCATTQDYVHVLQSVQRCTPDAVIAQARQEVETHYNLEVMAEEYRRIYMRVILDRGGNSDKQ